MTVFAKPDLSRPTEYGAAMPTVHRLLHVTGTAYSLRQQTLPLHRIEMLWLQRAEQVHLHGSVLVRTQQPVSHFDTYLNTTGQLARHTVSFPLQRWHSTISHHAGTLELVQTVMGHTQVHTYHSEHEPISEGALPCHIQANWSRLMQGYRCVINLIRLPGFSLQACEIFKGDDYHCHGEHRVDFVMRFLDSASQIGCLPVVMTFAVVSKQLLAFEGVASYTGGIAVPVAMHLTTREYTAAAANVSQHVAGKRMAVMSQRVASA